MYQIKQMDRVVEHQYSALGLDVNTLLAIGNQSARK